MDTQRNHDTPNMHNTESSGARDAHAPARHAASTLNQETSLTDIPEGTQTHEIHPAHDTWTYR